VFVIPSTEVADLETIHIGTVPCEAGR
jgi:hypothetical protein